jgi:hypothetical protein
MHYQILDVACRIFVCFFVKCPNEINHIFLADVFWDQDPSFSSFVTAFSLALVLFLTKIKIQD